MAPVTAGTVVNTWRAAHGRMTTWSKWFRAGVLTDEVVSSERARQEGHRAMLPGVVVRSLLYMGVGVVLEIT